jgi:nitroreductase
MIVVGMILDIFAGTTFTKTKNSTAMNKVISHLSCLLIISAFSITAFSQDIVLPSPDRTGGKPLMQALNERQTTRSFTEDELTPRQLSELLWAAWGINREDIGKRTAPSAMNYQEIQVYVALPAGLYLYDAQVHSLKMIHNTDIRRSCGTQSFVYDAPVNLIYVADMSKTGRNEGTAIKDADLFMPYSDAAFIAQNVYLYCASEGLGCVVRGSIPKERLAKEMGLNASQIITLAQTIGVPAN